MASADSSKIRGDWVEDLVARALDHLTHLQYKPGTREQFLRCWKQFVRFVHRSGEGETQLTVLGERFVQACSRPGDREYRKPSGQILVRKTTRVLIEFALHGCFHLRGTIAKTARLPQDLEATLVDYRGFCGQHLRHRRTTLNQRERHIRSFFHYLHAQGVDSASGISTGLLSGFLSSRAHLHPTSLLVLVGSIRSLLSFLCMRGCVSGELVAQAREFRVQRRQPLPSVWRREDVVALLAAVDRSSPVGKRDYAILLLAAQLGMRSGDIQQLLLDDIHWDQARIEFKQQKTSASQTLPMSEEIGVALIDYIQNGRPTASSRQVFLRAAAPFLPLAGGTGHLITKYRQMARVPLSPPPRWRGLHSLRHSLASNLLETGTPLEVIAAILGHHSQGATDTYIRIDTEALRKVALELEEVCDASA
jgi:integrase